MKLFTPLAVLLALLPAMGCADGSGPESGPTQTVAVAAVTGPVATGKPRRSTNRVLDPAQTNFHPRPANAKPNVDAPIPFDRPANPLLAAADSTPAVASPGTVSPALPLGSGAQLPASSVGVAVTCTPAPALKLACTPDAPTASTCTSADNLPAGCHVIAVPGAVYPDHAIPACCS